MSAATGCTCLLVLLASQTAFSQGKRVAMLPVPFTSHVLYHTYVARALADQGHEVWVLVADFVVEKGVLETTGFNVIRYTTVPDIEESFMVDVRDAYFEGRPPVLDGIFQLYKDHCRILLTDEALTDTLRRLDLDMVVLDNIFTVKALAVLPYRLGVAFSFLGTYYDPVTSRIPFSPSVTPFPLLPFSDRMTFWERATMAWVYFVSCLHDPSTLGDEVARYAPEMPYLPVDVLVARADLWLVETDHILDYPRPSLPNVKLIGGTAARPAQPLPDTFRSFMDGASEGVVVVSFGSYVLHLPEKVSSKILAVLGKLPFKAVFRSDLPSPDPGKVLTSPWIPQNDLLGHPKARVFFSHCGKNGQYQALYHAIPVVCAPIFTDQPYNAERMRLRGTAERVNLNTVTEDELLATVLKVATQTRYKRAISAASSLFRIELGVPAERAAFWLDHVMQHGASHMRFCRGKTCHTISFWRSTSSQYF